MAFSHVHQLGCATSDDSQPEQDACQWANAKNAATDRATFADAVVEMDWIVGEILGALEDDDGAHLDEMAGADCCRYKNRCTGVITGHFPDNNVPL
jgi:hypothetical protein